MEPRELVDQELVLIHALFAAQHEIYPMVILVKEDKRYQVPVAYHNSARKDIVAQGIKDLVKTAEPDVVIYIAEAWTKIIRDKNDRLPLAISINDPDKTEVVVAQIEFRTGEKFGCEAKIFVKDNIRQLSMFEVTDSGRDMGRFVDFFPIRRYN